MSKYKINKPLPHLPHFLKKADLYSNVDQILFVLSLRFNYCNVNPRYFNRLKLFSYK